VVTLLTFTLVPFQIALERGGSPLSIDAMLEEHENPRFQPLDFGLGVLCTITTRMVGFIAAAYVFRGYEAALPIPFVNPGAAFFGINDVGRLFRFLGHLGFSRAFGYLLVASWVRFLAGFSVRHYSMVHWFLSLVVSG
jgi:hypothetical protein